MWQDNINAQLATLEKKAQKRKLPRMERSDEGWVMMNGRKLLNLASNNYLGLADDERLIEASIRAMQTYGAGATASRLIVGNHALYEEAEAALVKWKETEAALIINSGYTANVGILSALASREDVIFSDKLNHASIVDGAILSRAELKRYRHNDIDHLETLLKKTPVHKLKIIVTDTVFSMDGDIAPLRELVALKEKYGAILMIDEAHSSGLYGEKGEGLAHHLGIAEHVDIHMGTFSKALGTFGAYVTGKKYLIDYLINHMRAFIFTTALPPAVLGSIRAAISIVQQEHERRTNLFTHSDYVRNELKRLGFNIGASTTQIVPIIIGDNERTVRFSERLQERGIAAVAIRPPTVPEGTARIRFSLMATLTKQQIDWALEQIALVGKEMGVIT
ncbi:8-amino-7-oxononanoate synthase [Thermolongibacillus altinsuensis]|uniref:8-amino-7-oxononanoate synthase n=1 Tax=Thermolongibacillus altinsuensis TaxID=575256 RepID=UPI00242A3097|nr:8-amino-7-oxononanoate synthase [Thermolongibacillus altinsuensis]GMB07935.1 putative 8-amino-7-oxononanoate synthase [Thermolongibacillus altinsuensis]